MKINTIVSLSILVAVVVLGLLALKQFKGMEKEIETISARKAQTINADSLRSVIESKILDSLKVSLKEQDAKINASAKVINQTRRKNEALEKRFNDIVITMPDF